MGPTVGAVPDTAAGPMICCQLGRVKALLLPLRLPMLLLLSWLLPLVRLLDLPSHSPCRRRPRLCSPLLPDLSLGRSLALP